MPLPARRRRRREERDNFGLAFATGVGDVHTAGDCRLPFALQSLSKVFVYALALQDHGRDRVLSRVGVEPSGDAFNSIVLDERHNRPYNPMVNAGALVTTDPALEGRCLRMRGILPDARDRC